MASSSDGQRAASDGRVEAHLEAHLDAVLPDAPVGDAAPAPARAPRGPRDAAHEIERYRERLLDLRNGNRLLAFKHSERSRAHVRAIHVQPDALYAQLGGGNQLGFVSLPEPDGERPEEDGDELLMALEEARATDPDYARALAESEEDDPDGARLQAAEGVLRERVREQLGLPPALLSGLLPLGEHARAAGIDPSFDLAPPSGAAPAAATGSIQTLLLADDMDRKLTGLHDRARMSLQEKGVNTLHAAFGFLEWYESPTTAVPFHAPLLLVPVEIRRKVFKSRYRYAIRGTGEEPQVNLTLAARLASDFGIALPELGEDEAPEAYFARVATAVAKKPRWCVRRWVTIGHFSFARLVMYQDLDPRNWPGPAALERQPLLARLLGERGAGEAALAEPHSVDAPDADQPDVRRKAPLLITDADSSQLSALVDALGGQSLAIQGPPGTGKSQTITNLIAAALAANKTVLFVAEKLAALEVVKNRLAAAGLGEFVLELHSTRTGKRDVLGAISERLKVQNRVRPPARLERDLEELADVRARLTRYAELVNGVPGQLGLTLHQLIWAELRLREACELPAGVAEVRVRDAAATTPAEAHRLGELLGFVERASAEIRERHGRVEDHPCRGITMGDLGPDGEAALLAALHAWRAGLQAVELALSALERDTGIQAPGSIGAIAPLCAALTRIPDGAGVDPRFFAALSERASRADLKAYRASVESFREAREELARVGDPARLAGNPAALAELARAARDLRLSNRRVAELPELLAEAREDVARWGAAVDTARQLLLLYGISGPIRPRTVQAAMEGARIVAGTPPEALALRERALMDPVNSEALESAGERQAGIQAELERLGPEFSLPLADEDAPGRLRRHAATLNGAGFFSFLSSRVREARQAWSELRRRPGQADDAEMSAQLYAIAAAVEEARSFAADGRLHELCTAHFRGHETNFRPLVGVNRFARDVRERLGTDSVLRQVRSVLFEGDLDTLNDIVGFASAEVRGALEWALGKGAGDTDWESFAAADDARARGLAALLEASETLGLAGEVELAELETLGPVAERALASRTAMEGAIAARLGDPALAGVVVAPDAPELEKAVDVVVTLVSLGVPEEVLTFLLGEAYAERRAALVEHGSALGAALERAGAGAAAAISAGDIDEHAFLGGALSEASVSAARERIDQTLASAALLGPWSTYRGALRALDAAGLTPLLAACEADGRAPENLESAYRLALYRSLIATAREQHAELAQFSGEQHSELRARFQELDREVMRQQCKDLRAELCRRRLDPGEKGANKSAWTGLALLQHEARKRGRHLPIRELVRRAGRTLQQAKPCFMMSPPSVAQYLAQGSLTFDLLVIDEASQMRPEDAIGALARAAQAVVVGDPEQLPPTGFFDRERPPTEEELASEERANDESILALALDAFRPARRLRWHYRSRHADLISFSNEHFYQGDLVVFPAPFRADAGLGVQWVEVENGLYRGSMNRPEAERVAAEALRFMQERPEQSLGIVAMNQAQRDLILHEIERLVARDARAQRYTGHWEQAKDGLEEFFVKSLETVQGDERDVIFVSATYGPDPGRRVHQRFGPINGAHGHRRLNVLFTRAKSRLVLFSSLKPEDVQVDEHASRGRRELRSYLEYARDGGAERGRGPGRGPESDLEAHVVELLRAHGYEVELRVGSIDLAVRHPQDRNAFVLGLETDGPSYASSRSARDRDRLREQVLANLGWQLRRIWSPDWHADPEREAKRLLAAVEQAVRRHDRGLKKAA